MKKIICILGSIIFIINFICASEFSDLIDRAKIQYSTKNYEETIQLLDTAKAIVESEKISQTTDNYIEVPSLSTLELKSDIYIGKKIKIRCKMSYLSKDSLDLFDGVTAMHFCKYEKEVVDKLLTMKLFEEYTFYGTVLISTRNKVYINIETIDN